MDVQNYGKTVEGLQIQHCSVQIMSSEIVEIGEDNMTITSSQDGCANDVYIAVGKDDIDVLKWALDRVVLPGARIFLVHVFPPMTYITTPVGRLSKSQLSQEQLRVYSNEENNKRRNLMQKYIRLCTDAKVQVMVDTMLIESNVTTKAILELIPVLNITHLVMGTKRPPSSRLSKKKLGKAEFVKKNAPGFCEVSIVYKGKKKAVEGQQNMSTHSSIFECVCFSGSRLNISN